jgi:sugar lactone lactonase YvrE
MTLDADLYLDAQAELAEGPVWDERASELVWVDILRGEIHRTTPSGRDSLVEVGEHVGAVALTHGDGLVLATRSGFRRGSVTERSVLLSDAPVRDGADLRMNDGKCDPEGRFVAGTMSYSERPGAGALWAFDGRDTWCLVPETTISNGMAWSASGEVMYFVDSPTRRVDRLEYDRGTGQVGTRSPHIVTGDDGVPDGITIDDEGGLWVALWGASRVCHFSAGACDEVIEVPTPFVTSCTLGGRDRSTLFITTARRDGDHRSGALFAVEVPVSGPPPTRFRPTAGDAIEVEDE